MVFTMQEPKDYGGAEVYVLLTLRIVATTFAVAQALDIANVVETAVFEADDVVRRQSGTRVAVTDKWAQTGY